MEWCGLKMTFSFYPYAIYFLRALLLQWGRAGLCVTAEQSSPQTDVDAVIRGHETTLWQPLNYKRKKIFSSVHEGF